MAQVEINETLFKYGTMIIGGDNVFYAKSRKKFGRFYTVREGIAMLQIFSSQTDALAGVPSARIDSAFPNGCSNLGEFVEFMEGRFSGG